MMMKEIGAQVVGAVDQAEVIVRPVEGMVSEDEVGERARGDDVDGDPVGHLPEL
jgi:hypothetical protein